MQRRELGRIRADVFVGFHTTLQVISSPRSFGNVSQLRRA